MMARALKRGRKHAEHFAWGNMASRDETLDIAVGKLGFAVFAPFSHPLAEFIPRRWGSSNIATDTGHGLDPTLNSFLILDGKDGIRADGILWM